MIFLVPKKGKTPVKDNTGVDILREQGVLSTGTDAQTRALTNDGKSELMNFTIGLTDSIASMLTGPMMPIVNSTGSFADTYFNSRDKGVSKGDFFSWRIY